MNKIYKVIWSKVKHQYVVVSELAHSNGKQSRTSRNSIRSRIAALVVCGAIAAFGVFSALPNSAYAAESGGIAKESQYIAIAIDGDGTHALNKVERDGYSYYKQKVKINNQTKYYYVREGYDISVVYDKRYDGANDESAYIIDAKKNNQYNASSDQGLLQAYQTTTSKGKITTLTGVNIEDLNTGVYGGASNSPSVDTPSDFGYHIKVNNLGGIYSKDEDGYIKVSNDLDGTASGTKPAGTWGNTNFETYFSYDVKLENDGTYSYTHGNEKVTVPTNKVYSIDGKLGVFTDAKGNLYTGDVYGDNNEILLSAVGEGNKIYSYWGTKVNDPTQTIGNMTVQDYNSDRKKLQDQAAAYHGDDITNIAVGGENNNGTISLNRVGQYNDQTGKYETTDPVPGTITVTSTGGNGGSGAEHDVKIKFSNTKNPDGFSVDAGSKVEAVTGDNGKVSQIKINGVDYTLGTGGTIAGSFNTQTGEISITQDGQRVLTGRVHDWNVVSGGFDPETGKLTLNTQDKYNKNETDKVEIDGVASTTYVDNKDALNVKYDSAEKTSVTLGGANGTQIHNVADGTDTKDAVNLGQLKNNIYDKYLSTATINKENGTLDLTVTNGNGEGQSKTYNLDLKGYIGELDDYVDEVKISDDKQSLVLKRRNGTEMSVDIADLAGAGLSTSDYHLIGSGEDGTGTYSPDKDGNIELQVKDEKTGTISKVKLEDIASADDVAGNTSSITEINNTLANGVVKYDYDSETKQYKDSVTLKGENGSQIHNLADGTDTKDAVNLGQLSGKTGDLQYNTNHYVTNDEDLTVSIGKLDTQVYQNTTSITKLQGQTIDGGYVEDGVINLTHKNGDNTTKTVAQIDGLEDYTLQNGQFITKAKDENGKFTGATELTIADKYDPTKTEKVTIDGLVTYNTTQKLDETTGETIVTGIDYDNIRLAGENGTRITNLVDGWVDEKSTDAVNGSQLASVKDGAVKYWQNEDGSYDKSFVQLEGGEDGTLVTHVRDGAVNEYSSDAVNGSQLWETQQQIKDVETTANKHTIVSTPEDSNLTVTNIAKNDEAANYQVELKDDITLGEGNNQIRINGSDNNGGKIVVGQGQKTVEIDNNSITLNKSLVIDGSGDHGAIIHGLSNNNWNPAEKDNSTTAATEGQLYDVYDGSVKYWQNQDGTYDKSFIQLEGGEEGTTITHLRDGVVAEHSTEAINGSQLWETQQQIKDVETTANKHTIVSTPEDSNLTVTNIAKNDEAANYQVALKDDITLKGDDSSIELNGTKGTIQVNQETAEGTDFTNINGNVVSIGYTNSEGTQNAIVIDGGKGTITGLSNTTWDGKTDNASRVATEGQLEDLSDTVNTGWIATDSQNHEVNITPDNNKLNFAGDENITVTAANNEIKTTLNDDIVLGDYLNGDDGVLIGGSSGTISATNSITVGEDQGLIIDGQKKEIQGLSNTTWNEKIANDAAVEGSTAASTAATQGQLQEVSKVANAGWTASDGTNSISVKPNETLNFVGDENLTVSADGTDKELKVSLNDDITLGDGENAIKIDGTNGTLNIGSTFAVAEDGTVLSDGDVIADADGEKYSLSEVGKYAVRYDKTNDGTSTITLVDGDDLSGTRIKNVADGVDPKDAVNVSQLEAVEATANAGWTASDGTNSISIKPNETLNFVGDENLTVSADGTDKKLKVSLNDNITLGNGQSAITLNGSPENSNDPALSVGTDKFVVDQDGSLSVSDKFNVDAETGNIYAANNSGSAIMMNDDSVALNAGGNGIAISDEGILLNTNGINEDIKLVTKGTSVSVDSNGTTFTNTNTNETTNIDGGTINVGDRLMVEEDGSIYATNNNGSTVMINDNGVALNSEGNGVVVSGEGITLNTNGSAVTVDRFNGATFTNTNTGETTNINGDIITTDTVKGLSNTTWDDELATQVANSEELQGTAATQGQLQQAVSAVATEAAKQHTTVSGDDNLTVKSSVNENGGTNYQVTLDDDITLGNPKAGNTEGERSFTINTTAPEGYVPDSYKEENSSGAEFIKENGGFMLFATDTQGHGIFGVTAKGSAWAKDFKTYTTDIYGNNTQYSLNDVGDAVAQMSSYYNKENGKSYTVFSRYLNEAEKDNPFATVDENATRDIPLALRDDGAVLIGATIKGDDFTDNGIRINAETETTYDGDGNEVTNNIATITGLENTEWKPPTPVATFAANDINTTSRAATEAQLDDLYSAVAAYDVNVDGTIDYSHIALAGAPYGASRAGNGTPTGGTSITNVAYASGKDGSEAVNVDYLNDAISDAAENGSISTSDQHLVANTETGSNGVYKPNDDGNVNLIVSDEKGNSSTITIGDVASKEDLDNLKDDVGDLDYSKVEGDTIIDGDSVTDAIGKLDNKIENISGTATDADNNTVTGGKINSDGTISLTQKDKDSIKLEGQLTDSGVVQEGTSFDKETGTITITSQDKYSGETSSVKVEGIASTEVVGATNKEDLATAYKDADKDGNATTEYITDSESMVEADVALDHAIQDVAGTSYANDMVLSNRIDSVEKRLGNVEERIDKVGAMAAAIANLRTMGFDPEAPTEIAIGVGQYKSETGIAIGVFHYPNQDFMLSASLSSSGDELMGGIGATWKLGRKSAAERAKDEEARHLEQAEEMKKLAQQEKVKAQAQRHAKLLAERQQASQKNA